MSALVYLLIAAASFCAGFGFGAVDASIRTRHSGHRFVVLGDNFVDESPRQRARRASDAIKKVPT